jgi:hypothetical protein
VRLRALVAGLALLVLSAVVFTTGAGRGAPPGPSNPVPRPTAEPEGRPAPPALPGRDVFEYADDAELPVPAAPPRLEPPTLEAPAPTGVLAGPAEQPVRLVGFVRRGGGLRAALAVRGSVYVLSAGEQAEGYLLLGADEDAGVRIQAPDGAVLTLPPAS